MLHVIKKQLALLQEPLVNTVPNGEFADLRQRLSAIKASLKYTSSMLSSTDRLWILQMQQQRQFSERFHESYPSTHDDTYVIAKEFAEGSQALYDKFTRDGAKTSATYAHIFHQIITYIREIEEVESEYSKLTAAKAETNRYQSKLDAMERSRKPVRVEKKQRNLQKMDTQREMYRVLLKTIVEKQKHIYGKHPIVFKASLTAFWLNHERHVTALVESLDKTARFAKDSEEEMKKLDITKYQPQRFERLSSIDAMLMPSYSNQLRSSSIGVQRDVHGEKFPKVVDDIEIRDGASLTNADYLDAVDAPIGKDHEGIISSAVTTPAVSPAKSTLISDTRSNENLEKS